MSEGASDRTVPESERSRGSGATVLRFPSNRPPVATQVDVDPPRLRDVIGDVLRDERQRQERTLADVADEAAVSLPYLSEVERGRKEVSSDVLDAIGTALDLPLVEILERSAERLRIEGRSVQHRIESAARSDGVRGQRTTRFQLAA
ncbi:MAG: helix-turn-helix domain-containing protein [Ilumatobacteraceae bacterium]|nr:helix-turn-helix domain-containing protein [Ilumatobacteraceae bacterium]